MNEHSNKSKMFSKADIEKYFIAEKNEALFFMILGIAAILLAVVLFFFLKTNWHKGAAIPFLLIGIIHLAAGYTVYKKSDKARLDNVYAYDMNPASLKNKELPRMEKVNKAFNLLICGEIALLLIGLIIFFYFKQDETKLFWVGFGLALIIEAAITFGGDVAAHGRARTYTKGLTGFTVRP